MRRSRSPHAPSQPQPTAADLLELGQKLLTPTQQRQLVLMLEESAKERFNEAMSEAKRWAAELEKLRGQAAPKRPNPFLKEASLSRQIAGHLEAHSGCTAGDILEAIKEIRPDINPKVLYAELFRLSESGAIFKDKTNRPMRYHLHDPNAKEEEVA